MKNSLLAIFLLFAVISVYARDVEILVEDAELGLPLEGAVLRSWDRKQFMCDENGIVQISVPDDRQVVIQAAYPGYESGRLVVSLDANQFTLGLRLSGVMEGKELVIEAARPGTSETKTGRSIAVSGRDIAQTAEIGIIEDVMTSIKLLPGVGYAGFFDAMPSIRGGNPGDMRASLDGYYIMNPYHWGGCFSIFDPGIVESAQLSHGVFSGRYGHSISGLLEITTKKPSPSETGFEMGISTSAANISLSLPLSGRGGILFMGRVTYYDPVIALAKQLAKSIKALEAVNSIRVAPYIRSGTITGNYRFQDNLELHATGFWGMDGIGVTFENGPSIAQDLTSSSRMQFNWTNYQGFITSGLNWNPRNDMLLKFTAGTGYEDSVVDGDMRFNIINKSFSDDFSDIFGSIISDYPGLGIHFNDPYNFSSQLRYLENTLMVNAQVRADYDWEPGSGFLAAAGVQEMFTNFIQKSDDRITNEKYFMNLSQKDKDKVTGELGDIFSDPLYGDMIKNNLIVQYPSPYKSDVVTRLFSTSAYALAEYKTRDSRFGAELGLRFDYYQLLGHDFSIPFKPALNPRLNLDFNVFKYRGIIQSFDLSAGTGLFSSIDDMVFLAEKRFNITGAKPNRSWTSVLGAKFDFQEAIILNIEAYYKSIYDRTYVPMTFTTEALIPQPNFNGEGKVWGIDAMLQKLQSRWWDGWLSYSFSWVKYRNPGDDSYDGWFFPQFHRFHNLNLVLNIKPAPRFNIYTRFGLASGTQIAKHIGNRPVSYPVYVIDPNDPNHTSYFIEKYYWLSERDEYNRTTPSLPLDVKFSIFGKNKNGRTRYELYIAIENMLALLYSAQGNTSFNQYTGKVETGSNTASYEIPIPIPSFGFKVSY